MKNNWIKVFIVFISIGYIFRMIDAILFSDKENILYYTFALCLFYLCFYKKKYGFLTFIWYFNILTTIAMYTYFIISYYSMFDISDIENIIYEILIDIIYIVLFKLAINYGKYIRKNEFIIYTDNTRKNNQDNLI